MNVEDRIKKLEEGLENQLKVITKDCPLHQQALATFIEHCNSENQQTRNSMDITTKKINEVLELMDGLAEGQRKTNNKITAVADKIEELKTFTVVVDGTPFQMGHNEFSKWVSKKVDPKVRVKTLADSIRNWTVIIGAVVFVFGMLFAMYDWNKREARKEQTQEQLMQTLIKELPK